MPLDTSNAKAAAAFITLAASALVITAATNTMFLKKADADAPVPPEPNLSSRYQLGKFENSRSESLFTLHLPSTTKESSSPSAMLVLAHGLAEHCCRPRCKCVSYCISRIAEDDFKYNIYSPHHPFSLLDRGTDVSLYESLSNAGVDVYAYDHHGHGRSGGMPRGYAEKFEHYVDDLLDYIRQCQGMYIARGTTPPPLILMGQSMGGLVSVMAALTLGSDKVHGLILTSPALGVDMNLLLTIQKKFAPIINTLAPKLRIVDAVRPIDLSRNSDAVKAYINDPLIQKGKTVARTAIVIDKTFDIVKERRHELSCPLLLLHGTDDKATSMTASIDFFRNVSSIKKQYLQLRGVYHEIYEDDHTPTFITSIVEFASTGGKKFATIVKSVVSRGSNGTDEDEKEEDGVIVIDCR